MVYYSYKNKTFPVKAQDAGNELERIESKYNGISPTAVVKESEPKEAVLHKCFEWDNDKAAVHWREQQARVLIGSIYIAKVEEESKEEETQVRAFVSIMSEENDKQYLSVSTVMNSENYTNQMLEEAKKEFEYFRNKFSTVKEFIEVFKTYDNTVKVAI